MKLDQFKVIWTALPLRVWEREVWGFTVKPAVILTVCVEKTDFLYPASSSSSSSSSGWSEPEISLCLIKVRLPVTLPAPLAKVIWVEVPETDFRDQKWRQWRSPLCHRARCTKCVREGGEKIWRFVFLSYRRRRTGCFPQWQTAQDKTTTYLVVVEESTELDSAWPVDLLSQWATAVMTQNCFST